MSTTPSIRFAPPRLRALVSGLLFAYLALVRTWNVDGTFWLLGDQIRDWTIALRPFTELPLTGAPSSVGGVSLGPVYYWTLWSIRWLVGPSTDNLPHAGGIGLSLLQSAADVVFLLALWRRTSGWFAAAVTLAIATAPQDLALSATIWNPPLSVALVKVTMALALLSTGGEEPRAMRRWPSPREIFMVLCAWLAVQAHSSAIFVAAPIIALSALRAMVARQWITAARHLAVAGAIILVLQIPLAVHLSTSPASGIAPTLVVGGIADAAATPARLRPGASMAFLGDAAAFLHLGQGPSTVYAIAVAAAAALVAVAKRRDLACLSVTVLPLLCAVAGFSTWQYEFDYYWYLTLMPPTVLTAMMAASLWRPGATGVVLLAVALVAQPMRIREAMRVVRMPEYRALVDGSRLLRSEAMELRGIETLFQLPATSDEEFVYKVLGGRIDPGAPAIGIIAADGSVTYRRERDPSP